MHVATMLVENVLVVCLELALVADQEFVPAKQFVTVFDFSVGAQFVRLEKDTVTEITGIGGMFHLFVLGQTFLACCPKITIGTCILGFIVLAFLVSF